MKNEMTVENEMTVNENELTVNEWLAIRKEAALTIDPESAEITWHYAQVLDPYSVLDLRPEEECIGREYFARAPGSDVWVWFGDLPDDVRNRLWQLLPSKRDALDGVMPF